jgi:hypothetical protein
LRKTTKKYKLSGERGGEKAQETEKEVKKMRKTKSWIELKTGYPLIDTG